MSAVIPFLFEGEKLVRVVERDGAPWFVATDVCATIGLKDTSDAVEKLDADEKGRGSIPTLGGDQEVLIISEGGLYTLVLRSRDATKPGTVAHRFRRWVTSEVLPTIRRTGHYTPPSSNPITRKPYDEWDLEEERVAISTVALARKVFNNGVAAWMWRRRGLPDIPEQLLPDWAKQRDLFGPGLTITVNNVQTGGRS